MVYLERRSFRLPKIAVDVGYVKGGRQDDRRRSRVQPAEVTRLPTRVNGLRFETEWARFELGKLVHITSRPDKTPNR